MNYKISIIIPVYNVEDYIRETLESIVRQTIGLDNLEVIMVNDCSNDRSGEIIDRYANKYANFIAIHLTENSGFVGTPRNIGMEKATSDYIMFLDGDDIYNENICQTLYKEITNEDVDVVSGSYALLKTDGKITKICFDTKGFKNIDEVKVRDVEDNINLLRLPPMIWTKIFKRSFLVKNNIKFPEGIFAEDVSFVNHVFLKANGIIFINNYDSYYYRIIETSISFQFDKKHIMGFVKGYIHTLKIFQKYGKEKYFPITIIDHLGYLLEKILLSNLSNIEIKKILNKSEIIFEQFKNMNLVPSKKHTIPIFNHIVNKRYDEAISLIETQGHLMKNQKKLITIILPVYNVENHIEEALESIVRQTIGLDNLEVIMVNDCSTDRSGEIIDEYANKYANFIAIHLTENSGFAGTPRNIGMEKATSDYIMFLDSDDYYNDDACEILYKKITGRNADIVFGKYIKIDENLYISKPYSDLYYNNVPEITMNDNNQIQFFIHPPSIWTKIFKRSFLIDNDIKFPEFIPAQDLVFMVDSLFKAKNVVFINKILTNYIVRNTEKSSITFNRSYKYINGLNQALRYIYDICMAYNYEEYFSYILKNHILYWMRQFILSGLPISEKKEALKSSSFLFKKYYEYEFTPPNYFIKIFDSIINYKYDETIQLADELTDLMKNEELYPIPDIDKYQNLVKSKENQQKIFILCDVVSTKLGGLAKVVIERSKFLSGKGYDVSILTIESGKNYDTIESVLKKNLLLNTSVDLINIYDYFRNKNSQNPSKKYINNFEKKSSIHEMGYQLINEYGTKKIVRYFQDGIYIKLKKWRSNGFLEHINYYDGNGYFAKREYYSNGFLTKEYSYKKGKVVQKRHFTKDGFCYLTENFNHQGHKHAFYLTDRMSNNVIPLKTVSDFHKHFLSELCETCDEKPYLICDGSGPTPSIGNIDPNLTYKISQLHSNPYTGPYCYGGPTRNIGILKDIGNNDAFIILTKKQKKDIMMEFGDYGNLYTIPNFVIKNELLNIDKNPNKISIFSRIAPEKNLEDAIKSFKIVVKKRKNARLEIFGRATAPREKTELKKIKKQIKKLGLKNNVFIKGYTNDVNQEMEESIATILTSNFEGFGRVIIESMLNGTPVISYDSYYGPSEIIDHEINGFLVETNNIKKMAEYMIELLDNTEKAKKMGMNARKKVLEFYTNDVVIPQWEKLFKKLSQKTIPVEQTELETQKYLENISYKDRSSTTQKLISKFPSAYILIKIYKTGIKNALINIKGYKQIKKNNLFDIVYYLNNNANVRKSGMDPVLHYIFHGYKEGREPNPTFNGKYYLKKHKDVKKSNLNPLVHYALYGIKENRKHIKNEKTDDKN